MAGIQAGRELKLLENFDRLLILLFLAILVLNSSRITAAIEGRKACPDKVEGNLNASFVIKYFYSPYCFYCALEHPVLEDLVKAKGELFRLEWYNTLHCKNVSEYYKTSGTPAFAFVSSGSNATLVRNGYLEKAELTSIICRASGGC